MTLERQQSAYPSPSLASPRRLCRRPGRASCSPSPCSSKLVAVRHWPIPVRPVHRVWADLWAGGGERAALSTGCPSGGSRGRSVHTARRAMHGHPGRNARKGLPRPQRDEELSELPRWHAQTSPNALQHDPAANEYGSKGSGARATQRRKECASRTPSINSGRAKTVLQGAWQERCR